MLCDGDFHGDHSPLHFLQDIVPHEAIKVLSHQFLRNSRYAFTLCDLPYQKDATKVTGCNAGMKTYKLMLHVENSMMGAFDFSPCSV
jgi:hypothetical protein